MGKRGQITVFIIVGLLIAGALLILLAGRREAGQDMLPAFAGQQVQAYVSTCLQDAAAGGLDLLRRQGTIYAEDMPGKTGDPTKGEAFVDNQNHVRYGIKNNIGDYPDQYGNHFGRPEDESVVRSLLVPLCNPYKYSLHYWDLEGAPWSCMTYADSFHNIQNYLEEYVEQQLIQCRIAEAAGAGSEVTVGNPTVRIRMGESDLIVAAEYPVSIDDGGERRTDVARYAINPQVRLKKMHELASEIVLREVTELRFDPRDFQEDGMSVSLDCSKPPDAVVVMKDARSLVNGRQFSFPFAVQNRSGVLENDVLVDPDDCP